MCVDMYAYCCIKMMHTQYTKHRRTLSFWIQTVHKFLNSVHRDTNRETQFLKTNANHTMLTPLQRTAHLVMFKISVDLCRSKSEKLNLTPQRSKTQLYLSTVEYPTDHFSESSNPQNLRTISSSSQELPPCFIEFPLFLFTYLFYFQNSSVSYNYGNLTFLFILFYLLYFHVNFDN